MKTRLHTDTSLNTPRTYGRISCVNTGGSWRATLKDVLSYVLMFLPLWGVWYIALSALAGRVEG